MDELLLRQAQNGNPEAFESLMGSLESLVWRVCWHYTGSREDASDCAQETMIRIWRGLPSFRSGCVFETWVYRVAANCCLDFLRRRKKEAGTPLEPLMEQGFDPPDPSPGTEAQVLRNEEYARLRQAVADLPEEQRDALVLTQLEGKSYADVSEMLGVTEGTVKSRVNRARTRLKSILSGELFSPDSVQNKERRDLS